MRKKISNSIYFLSVMLEMLSIKAEGHNCKAEGHTYDLRDLYLRSFYDSLVRLFDKQGEIFMQPPIAMNVKCRYCGQDALLDESMEHVANRDKILVDLNIDLKTALKREDYERASTIRDAINKMEHGISN